MNITEKRNLTYRLISGAVLLISLALMIYSLILIIMAQPKELVLDIIALSLAIFFIIGEEFILLRGWKKDSYLYKIAFNDNNSINNVPLIAVSVGTAFGLGLMALGISVYFVRFNDVSIRTSMLVVLSIAVYLVVNCLIYFFYVIFFKKRPFKLADLIK